MKWDILAYIWGSSHAASWISRGTCLVTANVITLLLYHAHALLQLHEFALLCCLLMEETACVPWLKLRDSKHIFFWSHQRADLLQRSSPLLSGVRTSPLGLGRTLLEEYDVLFFCFFLHFTAPLWSATNIYVCIGLEGTIFYLRWIRTIRERSLFKVKHQIWSPAENGSESGKIQTETFIYPLFHSTHPFSPHRKNLPLCWR